MPEVRAEFLRNPEQLIYGNPVANRPENSERWYNKHLHFAPYLIFVALARGVVAGALKELAQNPEVLILVATKRRSLRNGAQSEVLSFFVRAAMGAVRTGTSDGASMLRL